MAVRSRLKHDRETAGLVGLHATYGDMLAQRLDGLPAEIAGRRIARIVDGRVGDVAFPSTVIGAVAQRFFCTNGPTQVRGDGRVFVQRQGQRQMVGSRLACVAVSDGQTALVVLPIGAVLTEFPRNGVNGNAAFGRIEDPLVRHRAFRQAVGETSGERKGVGKLVEAMDGRRGGAGLAGKALGPVLVAIHGIDVLSCALEWLSSEEQHKGEKCEMSHDGCCVLSMNLTNSTYKITISS